MKVALMILVFLISVPSLTYSENGGVKNKSTKPANVMREVKKNRLCMNKNLIYKEPQMYVHVGKKTYYACCSQCYKNLKNNKAPRFAKDPLTNETVDKADAFVVDWNNRPYYFKNRENAEKFAKKHNAILE